MQRAAWERPPWDTCTLIGVCMPSHALNAVWCVAGVYGVRDWLLGASRSEC